MGIQCHACVKKTFFLLICVHFVMFLDHCPHYLYPPSVCFNTTIWFCPEVEIPYCHLFFLLLGKWIFPCIWTDYLVDEGTECNATSDLLLERNRELSIVDLLVPSLVLLITLLLKLQVFPLELCCFLMCSHLFQTLKKFIFRMCLCIILIKRLL
jgi:hypothetical protein